MTQQNLRSASDTTGDTCLVSALALLDRILNGCRTGYEQVIANRTARAFVRQVGAEDEHASATFGEAISHLRRLLDGCATHDQRQHANEAARDFLDAHRV